MSSKEKTGYVVGQQPPATLTPRARKQLAHAKPSTKVAEFAETLSRLFSTSSTGKTVAIIPGTESLKPGDLTDALSAKDAAAKARGISRKTSPKKRSSQAT